MGDIVESAALKALLNYGQADEDGVMCITSRQAVHDVADALTRLRAEKAELVEALEAAEALDWRDDCPECGGQDIPEICPLCFPKADAARVKRWDALAKAHGQTQAEWVAAMNAARAEAANGGETR